MLYLSHIIETCHPCILGPNPDPGTECGDGPQQVMDTLCRPRRFCPVNFKDLETSACLLRYRNVSY